MVILNQDRMTSHRLGGGLILLLLLLAALWIPQTGQANTIILDNMVVSKCFKQGLCEMGYAAGVANKEAQRFGFYLPKLIVQLRSLRQNPYCGWIPIASKIRSGSPSFGKKLLS